MTKKKKTLDQKILEALEDFLAEYPDIDDFLEALAEVAEYEREAYD